MSIPPETDKQRPSCKVSLWDAPPTWFGWGVGMMFGAALAGGSPWYRPVLVGFAGLCIAVGMLAHMRSRNHP